MTPVERLQAAITKLETLKASTTAGSWEIRNGWIEASEYGEVITPGPVACMSYCYGGSSSIAGDNLDADLDLIVTLHRTIDAQLAILRAARSHLNASGRMRTHEHYAVNLADAILGGAS